MANAGYSTHPNWGQTSYSIHSDLQLEHEYDGLGIDSAQGNQNHQQQNIFSDASFPPAQNFELPFSTNALSSGHQQNVNQRLSYRNEPRNGVGRQLNSFDSGHQNIYENGSSSNQTNMYNPNIPYVNSQSYIDNSSFPYGQEFHHGQGQEPSGTNMTATTLAESSVMSISPPRPLSSPPPIQTTFKPRSSPHSQVYFKGLEVDSFNRKRLRGTDDVDELKEEGAEQDLPAGDSAALKAKPPGACARCKNLKVKCEFKSDTDPCKRCMNGGHECVIPGRKKRRTPPKREHLLSQIRDQAAQIQKLMAQLEQSSRHPSRPSANGTFPHTPSPNTDFHSPTLDPDDQSVPQQEPKPEVQDWICKARESIEAFGGFIGIGGAGMPKSLLVQGELEDSESSENEDDDYEFAVEDSDGSVGDGEEGADMRKRKTSGVRSRSGDRLSMSSTGKKRDSGDKPMNLPSESFPFGLMANLALRRNRGRANSNASDDDENNVGVANEEFFRSSPAPDTMRSSALSVQQQGPHILTRGIITPKEAEKLFNIYFENMNLSVSLLDPVLYTAQKTCWRSPFLFTVICAIASRHYSERPDLYSQAMHYAQLGAGTALISGNKSVESVCGYILLALYPVPARKWEDDRSWLYLGLAIRIATDLNLHHPNTAKPLNEQHAREMLNRTRIWLNCFNLDRSTGSQYGKSPIIRNTDYIANHSEDWWKSSEYNMQHFDIHTCAYNNELRIMANFLARIYSDPKHPTGLNKDADFELIATETDDELVRVGDKWFTLLAKTDMTIAQNCFRTGLLRLAYSYSRLIALSFGFQHAFGKNNTDENPFLLRCLRAASDVVKAVVDDIGRPSQKIYLRHGPEAQSVFLTFASAFLVKLLQPKFASYLSADQRLEIRNLVLQVIELLGSKEVAIDERHGPKLYSRFLKGLLASRMARDDAQSPGARKTSLPKQRVTHQNKSVNGQTLSPDQERTFDFSQPSSGVFDMPSPATSTSLSMSPHPTEAAMSFDQFAPVSAGIDPFVTGQAPLVDQNGTDLGMDIPNFFQPPLPFDDEILQSIQSLSDQWSDMPPLPGFNWMTQFQGANDTQMRNESTVNGNQYSVS